jgi:hypothetical protein
MFVLLGDSQEEGGGRGQGVISIETALAKGAIDRAWVAGSGEAISHYDDWLSCRPSPSITGMLMKGIVDREFKTLNGYADVLHYNGRRDRLAERGFSEELLAVACTAVCRPPAVEAIVDRNA